MFDRTEQVKARTGQDRMRIGEAAFLGFSPSDILVDLATAAIMDNRYKTN